MERGPTMMLPTGKIIEGWPPDDAGEVLGPLVERGPSMRLPTLKILGRGGYQMRAGEVLGPLGQGGTMRLAKRKRRRNN